MKFTFKHIFSILLPLGAVMLANPAKAQLNPFGAMYFQNQYLVNPAMAGINSGLVVNLGYRQQWSSIQGSPTTQSLTAEYGTSKKIAFGINLSNDKAGLLGRTRGMATAAYHLPLSGNDQKLNFGISVGFMDQRVNNSDINGDQGDVTVGRYNDRQTYMDADFGLSYTSEKLTLQGAVPNLKNVLKKDELTSGVDRSTFMAAASYKITGKTFSGFTLEPKVAFRGIQGYKNIVDAGANIAVANNTLNLMGMYHSSKSTTFGVGMNFKNSISVLGVYTTETSALSSYVNGNFEIAFKVNLFK